MKIPNYVVTQEIGSLQEVYLRAFATRSTVFLGVPSSSSNLRSKLVVEKSLKLINTVVCLQQFCFLPQIKMCGNCIIKFQSLQTKHFGPDHHGPALAIKHFLLNAGTVQQHLSWSCSLPSSAGRSVTLTNEAATDSSNHTKQLKVLLHYYNNHLHAGNDQVIFFVYIHIYIYVYTHMSVLIYTWSSQNPSISYIHFPSC